MPRIEANGIGVHYAIEGHAEAPVVMLSNSLGTRLEMWEPQIGVLTERWRVLRYDTRGHGRTDVSPGLYTIDLLAEDAKALLDALGLERVHFCGLSLGGMIGQALAARHGDRIASLALCATACRQVGTAEVWEERIRAVERGGMKAVVDGVTERWFTAPFRTVPRAEIELVREMLLATPPAGYAACCAAVRDMDLTEAVGNITAPTLIVAGEDDPVTPPDKAREMAERIAGAELKVIPQAAHLVNLEQAALFNQAVGAFLTRAGGR